MIGYLNRLIAARVERTGQMPSRCNPVLTHPWAFHVLCFNMSARGVRPWILTNGEVRAEAEITGWRLGLGRHPLSKVSRRFWVFTWWEQRLNLVDLKENFDFFEHDIAATRCLSRPRLLYRVLRVNQPWNLRESVTVLTMCSDKMPFFKWDSKLYS